MPSARYIEILRLRGTGRPLLAALVGRIPDAIAVLAIVVVVRASSGSYSSAGAAAAAFGLGTALSAPLVGRAIDRLGQRRVLLPLAMAFAAALAALGLAAPKLGVGWSVSLAAAAGLTRPPLDAALRAFWPRRVDRRRLDAAYGLDSTLQELIWIGGPLLLAALLALGAPGLPLLACALLSLAGTVAYVTSPDLPTGERRTGRSIAGPLSDAGPRVLLTGAALYGVGVGILTVTLVAFAAANGSPAGAGLLIALWGVGSLGGGIAYGSRSWRAAVEDRAIVTLAAFALALALLASAPNLTILALLMLPLGLPLSPWLGSLSAAIQRAVRPDAAAEAFTWMFATITAGIAGGNAIGGVLTEAAGTDVAFVAAGGIALSGALWAALRRSAMGPQKDDGFRPVVDRSTTTATH
jgi:predicted MFS family arabinose efflux permease